MATQHPATFEHVHESTFEYTFPTSLETDGHPAGAENSGQLSILAFATDFL